ncbi:MAG: SUMF1/EgtB/PvdO family nonheme iron enzyme [Candidatus Sumerlaeia bacterium]
MRLLTTAASLALLIGLYGCNKQSAPTPAAGDGSLQPAAASEEAAAPAAEKAAMPIVKCKLGQEMVQLPGGKFKMGSATGEANQAPVHEVTVKPFLIDRTEVAQEIYIKLTNIDKSKFKGPTLPAEQIPWADAAKFCNARSEAEGLTPCYNLDTGECNFDANGYRLPTEAEWEYAARAGSDTDWFFGGNESKLADYAWVKTNSAEKTHPVGTKKPNAWGIYDMYGNVAEWCNDVYDANYYKASPADDPRGAAMNDNPQFTIRGGAYRFELNTARSAWRQGEFPGQTDGCIGGDYLGFRCVRKVEEPKK